MPTDIRNTDIRSGLFVVFSFCLIKKLISNCFKAPVEDPNFEGFCDGTMDKIHVGDFDADGRKDLVCRMNNGQKYYIALTGKIMSIFDKLMIR